MPILFRTLSTAALLCAAAAPAAPGQTPQIAELHPASVVHGSGGFTLVIRGSGFVPGTSRVAFDGRNLQGAVVTPTSITVAIAANLVGERIRDSDFRDDGRARLSVLVLNGSGGPTDVPTDRATFYVARTAQAIAPPRPPAPILTGLGPSPVPAGGTLVITGDHFDAPGLSVTLMSRDPAGRSSSYNRDRYLTRTRTEVRVPLEGVPEGSYTLRIEAEDRDRRELATLERPVVVGTPTRLGPPTVTRYGPTPVVRGARVWIEGTNFADDARVSLARGGGGGEVVLPRTPNAQSSQTRLYVTVPGDLPPGDFVVRVTNPGAGTAPAEVAVAVQHPEQPRSRPGSGTELGGGWQSPAQPTRPGSDWRSPAQPAPGRPGRRPDPRGGGYDVAITAGSLCLTPEGDRDGAAVRLRPCDEGGAMFRIENGYVATAGGRCLDWGTRGGPIHLMPCKEGRPERSSQQWYFHPNKLVQNALHDDVCMDVRDERIVAGTPVIAYACRSYDRPVAHQQFYPGGSYPVLSIAPSVRSVLLDAMRQTRSPAWVLMSDGTRVISAGSGNVISAGGGNVISAGSGNVISAGSGNVVSAGGLNLRVVSDPNQLLRGARVISAGSGNVISAGSGNVISAGSGNVISAGSLN